MVRYEDCGLFSVHIDKHGHVYNCATEISICLTWFDMFNDMQYCMFSQ